MTTRHEDLRARLAAALDTAIAERKARQPAAPPPRYDDVFFEGTAMLDALARGEDPGLPVDRGAR